MPYHSNKKEPNTENSLAPFSLFHKSNARFSLRLRVEVFYWTEQRKKMSYLSNWSGKPGSTSPHLFAYWALLYCRVWPAVCKILQSNALIMRSRSYVFFHCGQRSHLCLHDTYQPVPNELTVLVWHNFLAFISAYE